MYMYNRHLSAILYYLDKATLEATLLGRPKGFRTSVSNCVATYQRFLGFKGTLPCYHDWFSSEAHHGQALQACRHPKSHQLQRFTNQTAAARWRCVEWELVKSFRS